MQGLCAIYIPDFVAKRVNISRKINGGLIEYPLAINKKITQRAFLLKHKDLKEDGTFEQLLRSVKMII